MKIDPKNCNHFFCDQMFQFLMVFLGKDFRRKRMHSNNQYSGSGALFLENTFLGYNSKPPQQQYNGLCRSSSRVNHCCRLFHNPVE